MLALVVGPVGPAPGRVPGSAIGGYRIVDLGLSPELGSGAVGLGPGGLIAGWTWIDAHTGGPATWRVPGTAPPRIIGPENSSSVAVGPRGEVIGEVVSAAGIQVVRWWRGEQTVLSDGMVGQPYFVDIDERGRVLLASSDERQGFGVRITDGRRTRDLSGFPAPVPPPDPRYPWGTASINGMNERSQIVGSMGREDSPASAFVWQDGAIRYLPTLPDPGPPGVGWTSATAIDARGVIIGTSTTDGGASVHLVMWRDGRIIDLGLLPGASTCTPIGHSALFETGYIVGSCYGPGADVVRGFVWHRGTLTDVGNLGQPSAAVTDVNERGQAVGTAQVAGASHHGFVWERGVMIDLGTLGGAVSTPTDIDEQGRITGSAELANGRFHAVLWLPRH